MVNNKLYFITLVSLIVAASMVFAVAAVASPVVTSRMYLSVDKLRPGDNFKLAVEAIVQKGLHVNADPINAPLSLKLSAPQGVTFMKPVFPPAKRKAFKSDPGKKLPIYEGKFVIIVDGRVAKNAKIGSLVISGELETQSCGSDQCMLPEVSKSSMAVSIVKSGTAVKKINKKIFACAVGEDEAKQMCGRLAGMGTLPRLLLLYAMGLLLAFTPCVYPMIPVTVGYFSTQTEARRSKKILLLAAVYVLGLALTYSILGAIAATTGGMFSAAMQNPVVLVGIAVLLIALALSMFGLYELKPPQFILSRASGRTGVLGALIMGLIFGIVAAPCVGPAVAGLMMYVALIGSPAQGFMLFFALALGIGTPLFFLAAFSAKMPVPGMWMVAVKKVAGFLLIGAAAYFVQTLLPDSISRYLIPAVVVVGGIYLGFFEKSLKTSKAAVSFSKAFGSAALVFAVFMSMPHAHRGAIKWEPYKPDTVAMAIKAGKPVMIDFTAKWCPVCQELEAGAFSDPKVIKASQRFARFRVDGTNRKDALVVTTGKKYNVKGYPAIILLDNSGQEVTSARIIGKIEASEMLERLNAIR